MTKLEIGNLTKQWPQLTLDVSLSIMAGSLTAIVGPSGCGKSTLLRLVAGLIKADSGSLRMDGTDISQLPPAERKIGLVFQDYALFPHLDVLANVGYGLHKRNISRQQRQVQASRFLSMVGLAGFEKRRIFDLSGGEKQRVALARTMATRPEIILFDEPLASLDATLRKRLRQDIRDEQKQFGFTALYVTHDLEEAMAIADTIAIMHNGQILQAATPAEIWQKPVNACVARIMGNKVLVPINSIRQCGTQLALETALGPLQVPETMHPGTDKQALWLAFSRDAVSSQNNSLPQKSPGNQTNLVFEADCLSSVFLGDYRELVLKHGNCIFTIRQALDCYPQEPVATSYAVAASDIMVLSD